MVYLVPIRNNYALICFWSVYTSYLTTLIDLPVCQDISTLFPNLRRVLCEDAISPIMYYLGYQEVDLIVIKSLWYVVLLE